MTSTKKNIPSLRFPGFEGEWEVKQLGEYLEFKNGINASKEQYGSGFKFINVLDILNNVTIKHEDIIGRVNISKEIFEKNIVQYGDVLFQRSSETREDVGLATVYVDRENDATFGGFVIRGKQVEVYDPFFMNYILKTSFLRKEISSKSGGSTRYNVGQEILRSVNGLFPTLSEQQKIATFLTSIDERIQQLQQQHRLLQDYKKGMMQRLFSQELRFKQDDGRDFEDWEIKKGSEIFESHSNKNHNGDLKIIAITQEKGPVYREDLDMQIISSEKSIKSYKVIEVGDFIISLRSFQGGIEYSEIGGICSPAYTILKPRIKIYDKFFKFYMKKESFIERLSKTVVGIRDGKQISYSAFGGLKMVYPTFPEQQKIATFLTSLDEQINQVSAQVEEMQGYKKGLLQQLFC